ncbi:MAG: class I tRNA ligase family protein, partial [Vallitaleaceae bacterium]|nr:class I tRNA ligase family protein [Vallitaleaceae bacterium]
IWNASRFIMMNLEDKEIGEVSIEALTPADRWILSKVNTLAADITENMNQYDMGIAVTKLHDFIWEEFCDWYIEMVKPRLYNDDDQTKMAALWTLRTVLIQSLKCLHPFMPFITEEIFQTLQSEEPSIMVTEWPVYKAAWHFESEEQSISLIKEAVHQIRNVRANMSVPPKKKAKVFVVSEDAAVKKIFEEGKVFFATLGYASKVTIQDDNNGIDPDAVSVVIQGATIYMPFTELVDIDKEIERLSGEKDKLLKEIVRVTKKLSNQGFVAKAPAEVIEEERAKQEKYEQMLTQVEERLQALK